MLKQAMPAATEQNTLEMQLRQVRDAVRSKIKRMGGMQDGLLKDTETALERDFTDMRSVMRELEILAEDQEYVKQLTPNAERCSKFCMASFWVMCREEEDEDTLHRLQQYQQQYQDLQTAYSNAKLANKTDPHEANRQMLLAGADPTKRQRELQVTISAAAQVYETAHGMMQTISHDKSKISFYSADSMCTPFGLRCTASISSRLTTRARKAFCTGNLQHQARVASCYSILSQLSA